jgi:hypothetical protein
MFLNEAYQGKHKELVAIEKKLDIMCNYFKLNSKETVTDNQFKVMLNQIEDSLAELFGFETVFITIEGRLPLLRILDKDQRKHLNFNILDECITVNAYTFPATNFVENAFSISTDDAIELKNGVYKYKSKRLALYISVYSQLFRGDFTGGEILAIILHEIGHNFYQFQTFVGSVLNTVYTVLALPEIVLEMFKNVLQDRLLRIPVINVIAKIFDAVVGYYAKIVDELMSVELIETIATLYSALKRLSDVFDTLVSPALLKIIAKHKILKAFREGYNQEKFSDEFAMMLGYGTETASAQMKLAGYGLDDKEPKDKNFILKMSNTLDSIAGFPLAVLNPHPESDNRIKNTLKYLKNQRSMTKNAKLQKVIDIEIKNTEEILRLYKDYRAKNTVLEHKLDTDFGNGTDIFKEIFSNIATFGHKQYDTNILDFLTNNSIHDLINKNQFGLKSNSIVDQSIEYAKKNFPSGH